LTFSSLTITEVNTLDLGHVDQQCAGSSGVGGGESSYSPGQTFIPRESILTGFALYILSYGFPVLVTYNILNGTPSPANLTFPVTKNVVETGNITAPVTVDLLGHSQARWLYFHLIKPLTLIPGNRYSFEVRSPDGAAPFSAIGECSEEYGGEWLYYYSGHCPGVVCSYQGYGKSWNFKTFSSEYSPTFVDSVNTAFRLGLGLMSAIIAIVLIHGSWRTYWKFKKQRSLDEWE
jgi:hypothetical protein